jgi:mevalonate kinase
MRLNRGYPAKLLLFGEYTVLSGSRALAIPLSRWQGRLSEGGSAPNEHLLALSKYLDQHRLFSSGRLEKLKNAVNAGLYFESDIPRGYGVGSSGALCAALYDEFLNGRSAQKGTPNVRQELAAMETYFHGTSSGMDPLVSLLNTPVLRENERYHLLSSMQWPSGLKVFLLDSGVQRATGDLVREYLLMADSEEFRSRCLRPMIQSVDHAISFLLDAHLEAYWEHVKLISHLQHDYFMPMIVDGIAEIWASSLDDPDVAVKLCGAGGGGFYLGFARQEADITAKCGEHLLLHS